MLTQELAPKQQYTIPTTCKICGGALCVNPFLSEHHGMIETYNVFCPECASISPERDDGGGLFRIDYWENTAWADEIRALPPSESWKKHGHFEEWRKGGKWGDYVDLPG